MESQKTEKKNLTTGKLSNDTLTSF